MIVLVRLEFVTVLQVRNITIYNKVEKSRSLCCTRIFFISYPWHYLSGTSDQPGLWASLSITHTLIVIGQDFNPFKPKGISHLYQLDQSTFSLSLAGW